MDGQWIAMTLMVYSLLGKNSKWGFLGEKFFNVMAAKMNEGPLNDPYGAHVNLLLTKSHTLRPVDHPSSVI